MKIGVVGTGTTGSEIALTALLCGNELIVKSRSQEALASLRAKLANKLSKMMPEEEASRLLGKMAMTESYSGLVGCDAVIEAVPENLELKQEIFYKMDQVLPPEILLASNTSSLLVGDICAKVKNKGRIVGLHFFNPVSKMKLV
jgi:3-hydroxyacyl-CoA dehydrogenase